MLALTGDEKKTVEESLKAIDVNKIDIFELMQVFIDFLNVYSELAIKFGTLERDFPESYNAIQNMGKIAPSFMMKLSETAPAEDFGIFVKAILKLLEIGPKMNDIEKLNAEEKITLGNQLKDITDILNKMIKKAKRKAKQKTE
jgi:hypothetical protein